MGGIIEEKLGIPTDYNRRKTWCSNKYNLHQDENSQQKTQISGKVSESGKPTPPLSLSSWKFVHFSHESNDCPMQCCVQAWLDDIKNILVLGLESLVPLELFSKVEQGSINYIFWKYNPRCDGGSTYTLAN